MRDMQKTKKQLTQELEETHKKLSDLEMIIRSMQETETALRKPDTNVVVIDRNATVRLLSPRAAGSGSGARSGTSFYDYALPEFRQVIRTCFERVLQTGESARFKSTYEYEDGTQQFFESSVRPVRQGGEITGGVVISQDVTGGHAEAAPGPEQFDPTQYFENLPVMAYNLTFDGKIADCNEMVASTLGYASKEELIGKPLIGTIYAPASRNAAGRLLDEWQKVGNIKNEELQVITKGGKVLDVMLNAATIVAHGDEAAHSLSTHVDITDLKQVQAAIAAERDNLYNVLAAIRDGVLVVSDTYDLLYVNQVLEETFGPWKGKKCYEYLSMGDAPCEGCSGAPARPGQAIRREWRCPKNQRTYEIVATSIRDPNGSRPGLHVIRDVTDRRLAEEALGASEEKFRAIVETGVDVVFQVDLGGGITYVSPSVEGLLGFRSDEIIGRAFSDFLKPSDLEMSANIFGEILAGGSFKCREIEVPRKAGPSQLIEVTPVPWRKNGQIVGIQGTVRDITARKRSERALQESEERFRLISENIPVVVYSAVPHQHRVPVFVSSKIAELSGYSGKDLAETPALFKSMIHADDREQAWEKIKEHRRKKTALDIEYRIVTLEGQVKWIANKATVLLDENGETLCVNGFLEDITERKRAEGALRESEARFRQLAESIDQVVWLTDWENKTLLYVNPGYEKIFGRSCKSAYEDRLSWADVIHQDDRARVMESLSAKARLGQNAEEEYRIVRNDGSMRWILDRNYPIRDKDGKVSRIVSVAEDITERKQVESDRQNQLEFLQTLIDTIPNPIFYKGIDQRYTGCNRAFEQFLGLPKTEIVGKSAHEISPKDLADRYSEKDTELLRHPGTQIYEWKVRTSSGEVRDVIFSKATFVGSDGKVAGLLGVIVDITDLKRIQAALQLREELYRSRFENSPIALWEEDLSKIKVHGEVLRSRGVRDFRVYFRDHPEEVAACGEMMTVTDANAATLKLFECGTLGDLEHTIRRHASHRTSEAFVETLVGVSEGARSFACECGTLTAGGQQRFLSLRWVIAPGFAETLSKVLFSALDITHLKDVETELRTAESQIRTYSGELEKMVESRTERIRQLERQRSASEAHAATGRLAARIAHEINNPLAGIKNSFLLVKRAVPKDHPRYEYVTLIEREIDRIALIVRKTFELYRDEKQVRHEVSAVDCIREVLAISESSLREREISAKLNAPDKPITANLPGGFLTQVLLNLLRNAIDASKPRSTITISADVDNGEMVVRVKDQGQGISDENAPHIFEPFFTTKGNTEPGGLGLGLAVSRSMVEAMGGSITFETCPGKGTTFTVCLPTSRGNKEVQNGRKG